MRKIGKGPNGSHKDFRVINSGSTYGKKSKAKKSVKFNKTPKGRSKSYIKPKRVMFRGQKLRVSFSEYMNGRVMLMLENERKEEVAMASANVFDAPLREGHVLIKNYGENLGIMDSLIMGEVLMPTGRRYVGDGCISYQEAKLL